jgi:flagellar basal body-associated protein FliL
LVTPTGRASLETQILSKIKSETDVKVDQVFFTDVAVQ